MTRDRILKLIVQHTREVVPELADHDFQDSDSLRELGANSVDRSEIVMMTLESLDLDVLAVELHGPENIGQLADLIYVKAASA